MKLIIPIGKSKSEVKSLLLDIIKAVNSDKNFDGVEKRNMVKLLNSVYSSVLYEYEAKGVEIK